MFDCSVYGEFEMFVETAACAMDQPLKDKGSAFSLSKKVERVSHAANDEEDTTDIGSHTRQAVTRPQEHQIEDPRHNEEETSKKTERRWQLSVSNHEIDEKYEKYKAQAG
jgi:hypothetical protein